NLRFERLLSRSINKAFQIAVSRQLKARESHVLELQSIVNANQIRVVFQPIVDLTNHLNVLGHEALSRGPEGSLFETADLMFSLAAECGIVTRLENLCQLRIISFLEKNEWQKLVFINLEPSLLEQDHYHTLALFHAKDLNPQNIVLEITERV